MTTQFDYYYYLAAGNLNDRSKLPKNHKVEKDILTRKDPRDAYLYARDILKRRWPQAEPIIQTNVNYAHYYAKDVIRGRWPEEEKTMLDHAKEEMQHPNFRPGLYQQALKDMVNYAQNVIFGRWPEAEPLLKQNKFVWQEYVKTIIDQYGVKDVGVNQDTLGHDIDTLMDMI